MTDASRATSMSFVQDDGEASPVKEPSTSADSRKHSRLVWNKEVESEAEPSPKDVHTGNTSPRSVLPFSKPCKVEACSSETEDLRKKINRIRQQRGKQQKLPHLDVQASCSRTADDQEYQEQNSEGTKRHALFTSRNPEENMDNENPDWEAIRQSNTPARKHCKRKTSHDFSSEYSEPAKHQHFDTDIFDLKLRELERNKEEDIMRVHNTFRYDMDMLHRDFKVQSLRYRGRSERLCYSGGPQHRRARTVPWDYYQVQKRKVQEQFMANTQSINNEYSARANKLLSARDEVQHFDAFYAGLKDSDSRLLSEQQMEETLKLEKLLRYFSVAYDEAKY
uniref:Uncharacterized protein n=1 Tax=Amblyomma maculatum TaxID=34609 RepID=G3MQZ0_AMBMU